MKLHEALGISSGDVVAFVGAGGKSGAILTVCEGLVQAGMKVLVAPTTKMMLGEADRIGPLVTSEDAGELRTKTENALSEAPAVVAGSGMISKNRVGGVDPARIGDLASLAGVVLVEADGSRRRPIKGTADHEPAIPTAATLVVAIANVQALGTPVDDEHVHRPEVFSELTGVGPGQSITPGAFASALARGSLARVPQKTRTAALITGVDPGRSMSSASVITRELWSLGVKNVVLSSLPTGSPTQVWVP
ncbi:MAG: putative selenium-dependent hydroxylase accessory protein YqeC [Rubrobacter sp.]|nr:putative selenium-dependent hydroxylase accessory protein YqeC [Rubrobacter sp.]